MKILKCTLSALLILTVSFSLSGCYDQQEINETAYMVALGIDKGNSSDFVYTLQFSTPLPFPSDKDTQNSSETNNLIVSANDFYTAKNTAENLLIKHINMAHLKMIVFSTEIDTDGLLAHTEFLLKEREIRPHTSVAVTENSAQKFIESIRPAEDGNIAEHYELMALESNNLYAPTKQLSDFVDELTKKDGASAIPIALLKSGKTNMRKTTENKLLGSDVSSISGSHSSLSGMAIFRQGKLCGTMNGDNALIYNILSQKIKYTTFTINSPDNTETLSFRMTVPEKASYKVRPDSTSCLISVSQSFEIEYLGGRLPKGFSDFDELFSYANQILTDEFSDFLYDISHKKNADILHIGNCYKKQFWSQSQWENSNWSKLYKNAKFSVNLNFI